ncbi:MAG: RNA polymerase sigma factor [Pseudonocardia sp.]
MVEPIPLPRHQPVRPGTPVELPAGSRVSTPLDVEAWEWVRAAQGGDREAFGRLYARYQPLVWRFVQRKVRDGHLAEDLTSETFLRALRGISSVTAQRPDPGAWLVTIARNLVLDHAKSAHHRLSHPTADIPEPRAGGPDQDSAEVLALDQLGSARAVSAVHAAMAGLRSAHQSALHAWLRDYPAAEEAQRSGVSLGAAKSTRRRAMLALRERLIADGLCSSRLCTESTPTGGERAA